MSAERASDRGAIPSKRFIHFALLDEAAVAAVVRLSGLPFIVLSSAFSFQAWCA